MELINSSITLLAKEKFNNFLLEHFFKKHNIIPTDWESKEIVQFPQISRIDFANGYIIQLAEKKILIQINYKDSINVKHVSNIPDKLPEITKSFLKNVENLNYTALGINFKLAVLSELKSVKWLPIGSQLAGLSFMIEEGEFILTCKLEAGEKEVDKGKKEIIFLDANFHRSIDSNDKKIQIIEHALSERENCFTNLKELVDGNLR